MKPESPTDLYIVSSSPHTHSGASVERIMLDVVIALMPAFAAALVLFRLDALRLTAVCVASCLLTEWLCRKAMRRASSLTDFSAAVTGLLLAFNLPPALPSWMAVAGSVFAVAVAKQVFGGLGYNPFNPALAGRAFMLISFTGAMTTWSRSPWLRKVAGSAADAVTTATPLGFAKEALKAGQPLPVFDTGLLADFFFGNMNGCIGETSALALLLGAAYLLVRKVITWHIPAAYLLTVLVYAALLHFFAPATSVPPLLHLLSGGLILGAFFMATDMVTTPLTRRGMLIFGVGCGVITMLIRTIKTGAYPEGVSFAILIMNAFTPLINRATRNRVFGTKNEALTRSLLQPSNSPQPNPLHTMKDTLKLILVLTAICAVSSALLAAVYSKTKAPIAAALELRTANAAAKVMPVGVSTPEKKEVGGVTFFVAKKSGEFAGVALEGRSKNGYGGEIVLMIGLSADGKLVNYQKLIANETPGLGTKMESDAFRTPLLGRPLKADWRVKKDGGDVDAITAATISSRAVMECLRDAIAKYEKAAPQLGVRN